jgi:hypothetical protein
VTDGEALTAPLDVPDADPDADPEADPGAESDTVAEGVALGDVDDPDWVGQAVADGAELVGVGLELDRVGVGWVETVGVG